MGGAVPTVILAQRDLLKREGIEEEMVMQLNSECACNSIIWISSMPANEQGPTRRMTEDMIGLSQQIGFIFHRLDVTSVSQLSALFDDLSIHADQYGMRPLIHFDLHGDKDKGLLISETGEYASWDMLAICLRKLNTYTRNNLCVIGAACFGIWAIKPIKLHQPTPFFILLAPEEEVTVGFLEENIVAFYRAMFEFRSIDIAYRQYLSRFTYFHCERMLLIVMARYIKKGCKGSSAQERRQYLLTEVFMHGLERTPENLRDIRAKIKQHLTPTQELLDRYAQVFLINKPCSFNMDQLLEFIEESPP